MCSSDLASWALLAGNFAIGCGVMVVAGSLNDLLEQADVVTLQRVLRAAEAEAPKSDFAVSGNFTLATDYIWRGLSQTWGGPAQQVTVTVDHASGAYFGFFASNVASQFVPNANLETDWSLGYKTKAAGVDLDMGGVERAGVVWAYLGPPELKPALPDLEWMLVPESHCYVAKRLQLCHWTQGMEGDLDPRHLAFLHAGAIDTTAEHAGKDSADWLKQDLTPVIETVAKPVGLMFAARRNADAGRYFWRVAQWMTPFFTTIPADRKSTRLHSSH